MIGKHNQMNTLDDEWIQFLKQNGIDMSYTKEHEGHNDEEIIDNVLPQIVCDVKETKEVSHEYELSISTKTEKLFLNCAIDIDDIFWKIPIVEYWRPDVGVIKKQMKIVSKTIEEYEIYNERLKTIRFYEEVVLKEINNPSARSIKFKDERKITIGLSKKDIMTHRAKKKNAFYNCFALVMRVKYEGVFREIHVKVFKTGKMEIPGVVEDGVFDMVRIMILDLIKKFHTDKNIYFKPNTNADLVLINSNFNCGFFIQRDKLHNILISEKYKVESSFDSCSYPGIKCKYYFSNEIGYDVDRQTGCVLKEDNELKMFELTDSKKYTEVSFMIFRTGSCLIVGNCSELLIRFIFDFIKRILTTEYENIYIDQYDETVKVKKIKTRRKNITCTNNYFQVVSNVIDTK
jgi:hypothetical protein